MYRILARSGLTSRLRGLLSNLLIQQPIDGLLRFTCGREDRPFVAFQNFEPRLAVRCIVRLRLCFKLKLGRQKGAAYLRYEFFASVRF